MRPRIAALAFVGAVAWTASAPSARASGTTECPGPVSPCINDDTLWPHAGPSHFVAVGSTETVAPGQLGFGLVTSYLSRPIVLHVPSPGSGGSSDYLINDQVNGTFLWSYGATDRLELDVALPLTFGQGGTGLAPITGAEDLHDTATRDMRFGFAYALVKHARVDRDLPGSALVPVGNDHWGLTARFEMSAPTGDHDQFAGEQSGVYIPSVAADFLAGPLRLGAEVGARLRPITELLGARVGTQLVAMAGISYDVCPRELLAASLEAWALPTLVSQGPGQGSPLVPAEWQVAARTALRGGDFSIQLGGGSAIPFGGETEITRPRFRLTLGIRWEPLARDTDEDGVLDSADKCPTIPARGTMDGCPVAPGPDSP